MGAKLVVQAGPEKGRRILLENGSAIKIGRGQASDEQLNDPRISRTHCTVQFGPEGATITDAGSSGGTFVAGKRIDTCSIAHGEEIRIGETLMRYELDGRGSDPQKRESVPRSSMSSKSLNDLVGQTLGHFQLNKMMHTSSSSVLFLATDQKVERPAVVKVMLPSIMNDEEQRSRFVRAVHTMIDAKHANLVEVYGAGKQGPFCWCAMEYVDGITILEMIELIGVQGRLDWQEVYRVAVHVARALEYAYDRKIIHRNVTPDNLLRRKNDQVVKVCDLMLAKALEGSQSRQVTAQGQLVGNVAYMSPERMVDTSQLDWRSDQYGLGATLFALLTGHPPFQASTLQELVRAVRDEQPKFPEDVRGEIEESFMDLVLKMISKQPGDRYLFPCELLRRLDDIGDACGVAADVAFDR